MIELGGNSQPPQQFHASPTNTHHLSGFVPLNFDPATSDETPPPVITHRPPHHRHPHLGNRPKNFSVVLGSGVSDEVKSPRELARLFKNGKLKKDAFIAASNQAPSGLKKIDLPFMEKVEPGVGGEADLPSVFIAPVGFKVPDGYKGHPLPFDPEVKQQQEVLNGGRGDEDYLTSPTVTTSSTRGHSIVRNKLKLAKSRPSLVEFYRNKARQEIGQEEEEDASLLPARARKKKRILTKVVRRPAYKTRTTPASTTTSTTEEAVITSTPAFPTVKVFDLDQSPSTTFITESPAVHRLEVETQPPPPPPPISVVGSLFDIQTERAEEDIVEVATEPQIVEEEELVWETSTSRFEHFEPTTQRTTTEGQEELLLVTTTTDLPEIVETTFRPTVTTTLPTTTTTTPATTTTTPTTTTTTTTTPSTTSSEDPVPFETTSKSAGYEPTPFSHVRPIRRLDAIRFGQSGKSRYQKQQEQQLPFSPTKLPRKRKYRKTPAPPTATLAPTAQYETSTKGKYKSKFTSADGRIFGTRIRARKRPTFWANGYSKERYYETTTTARSPVPRRTTTRKPTKTEVYKKK